MIPPIHFRVGNQVIHNELYARYLAFKQNQPISFECYDVENDMIDWTTEPTETMEDLMVQHALYLRNKYERIIFVWSGGTDSHTIYNIFVKNNIHIDEIIILYSFYEEIQHPISHAEWMINNHPDPTTKITPKNRLNPNEKLRIVTDENWMFTEIGMTPRFGLGTYDKVMLEYCQENHGSYTWCLMNGMEQPDVYETEHGFFSRHSPMGYRHMLGFDNAECFFTTPKLAVKQAHLIKKMIKHIRIIFPKKPIERFRFQSKLNYLYWTNGIGRHRELNAGSSYHQKIDNFKLDEQNLGPEDIDTELTRPVDLPLSIMIDQGNPEAKLYEAGLKTVLLEKDFCRHLRETSQNPNFSVLGKLSGERIFSKSYYIGK